MRGTQSVESVGLLSICIGFSVLAALGAFLTTYEEWSHHYPGRTEPLKHAMRAAYAAFVAFAVLTGLAAVLLTRFVEYMR